MKNALRRHVASLVLAILAQVSIVATPSPIAAQELPEVSPQVIQNYRLFALRHRLLENTESAVSRNLQIQAVENVLTKYNSPMSGDAETFILVAQEYNMDWRLLPSISGVESTFGRHVPYNSYNPFGWANGGMGFENWSDAIETVGNGVYRIYWSRGRTTPELMQPVYAPPSTTWDSKVRFFMNKFQEEYDRLKNE